jgi:hypothetical protein
MNAKQERHWQMILSAYEGYSASYKRTAAGIEKPLTNKDREVRYAYFRGLRDAYILDYQGNPHQIEMDARRITSRLKGATCTST